MSMKNPFKNKNIVIFTSALISCLFLISCKKQKQTVISPNDSLQLTIQQAEPDELNNETQNWHITNKRILVFLGYDFNSQETISKYTDLLSSKYGLDADGGLIYLITYPDSFKHSAKAYVSELTSFLTENNREMAGVIVLGAPENTHAALARLQDYWQMNTPYPVFALFPQDEVLGLESTCDFVLEKSQKAEITGDTLSEEDTNVAENAEEILIDCIDYMMAIDSALAKNLTLQKHAEQMLKGKKIVHYVDPESGIQSINHFILLSE